MAQARHRWRLGALALALNGAATLAACGSGVSQTDYDALQKQLQDQQQKTQEVQAQLSTKVQEGTTLQQQVTTLRKELTDAKSAPAASNVTTLIGAQAGPTPGPRATPTPLPPGFTPPPPAPKPTTPSSYYDQPVGPFYFFGDAVTAGGTSANGITATVQCTPSSVYKRGQKVAFRTEIIDMSTGKRITDKDGATIKVSIPGVDDVSGRWAQRGAGTVPDAPWMWIASWVIPTNYPLGSIDYTVVVTTKDGRTGKWTYPRAIDGGSGGEALINHSDLTVIE